MAFYSETLTAPNSKSLIRRFFAAIGNWLMVVADAQSRRVEIETLKNMSDAQLAELGVERDSIVQFVFRDKMF